MNLSFIENTRVVENIGELEAPIEASLRPPIAVHLGERWILLDDEALNALTEAVAAGRNARDLLEAWPATPSADRTVQPSVPSLVFQDGRVVGAWVAIEEPRLEKRESPRVRGPRRRGGPPMAKPRAESRGAPEEAAADSVDSSDFVLRGAPPEPGPMANGDGDPGAGPFTEPGRTLERTPHLNAPERIRKDPGTEFTVSVYADTEGFREEETGEPIGIALPPGVESVDVAVLVQVTPHFEVVGDQFGELILAENESKSNVLEFKLQVSADAPASEAGVGMLLNYRGRSCGYVARAWRWDDPEPEARPSAPEPAAAASIPVHVGAGQPDLSVFVTAPVNDGINYVCAVETPHIEGCTRATSSEPFAVPAQGYDFLKKLLAALIDEDKSAGKRLSALTEIGHEAFEAAPPNFREILWAMVDARVRPDTIYIASSQPTLPWELMIPRRFDGKQPAKLGPLGTEFAIGRWTRGDSVSPPPRLPVDRAFLIAPEYESEARILDAKAEIEFVRGRLRGERVRPATTETLNARFENDHAALLHFVCHGAAGQADDDAIWLDGEEELRAREMETLPGFEKLCMEKKPLVFMNSCETGQGVPSLGGGSGFPRSFGNLGASAVIAPLWPVDDSLASKIALELYEAALAADAPPLAVILRDMRKRGYEAKDVDTFAAYCFYGDPLARLELTG